MITRSLLEDVLEAWNREYGYGGGTLGGGSGTLQAIADFGGGLSGGGGRVILGTQADEFNAAWVQLAGGTTRDYRMAQALRADVMAHRSDPMEMILARLRSFGINMETREFVEHVEMAKCHFCATMTFRSRAA
jgi:hypothetical protein